MHCGSFLTQPLRIINRSQWLPDEEENHNHVKRFYSCKSSKTLHVGRVKAPTLGLVVNRDYAIENHIKQLHYILRIIANNNDKDNNITFTFQKNANTPVNEDKLIIDLDYIEKIQSEIADIKDYKVNVTSKILTRNPPLVFNIDKLQAYCNNKFSYTAQEVLEITQVLQATHQIITYNRSDSQYLNEEHFQEAPQLIEIIKENLNLSALDSDNFVAFEQTRNIEDIYRDNSQIKNLENDYTRSI